MPKEEVGGLVIWQEVARIVLKEEVGRLRYDAELRLEFFAFFPLRFLVDWKQFVLIYHLLLVLGQLLQLLLFL